MTTLFEVSSSNNLEMRSILEKTISKFIQSLDAGEATKQAYEKALKIFRIWIERKGCIRPGREHILEYKACLSERLSALTVSAYIVAVRRFFQYLESEKIYPDITRGIKGLKRPKGFLKDALTQEEARRLLNGVDKTDLNGLRDYALINLMLHTGLRTIEVSRALIGDISREAGETVLRIQGKGRDSKDDFVILTHEAYQPILDYLAARKKTNLSDCLFSSHSNRNQKEAITTRSLSRIVAQRLKAAGLKTSKITAHSLRHSAATIALNNGADLLAVKEMLRHENVNTTLVYTRNLNRLKNGAEKFIQI